MADVQPLKGIRYTIGDTVSNLADVVTPPYDVISEEAQNRYYERSPYNIIRLELGKDQGGDSLLTNRYTRAAATLAEWRFQHILQQDPAAYYLYQQRFTLQDQDYSRTSLLARVRLEPWSARVVLPHEHTLSKPKDDRLKLLRACTTNLSPIMSLYDDPQGRMRRLLASYAGHPEVHFKDEFAEEHLLQPITDDQQIALIQDFFAERQLYIADGHHRYETALNYREEVRAQRKQLDPTDAVNFVLMALTDIDDPGLVVLPTHRLISGLSQSALAALSQETLTRYFSVKALGKQATSSLVQRLTSAGEQQTAFIVSSSEQNWLLTPDAQGRARMTQSGHSTAWNELDVAIAHTLLLEDLLGLNAEDITAGKHVRFTRDAQEALTAIETGTAQLALLLNATKVRQVCNVALADDRMPQKSTYFYPKLITGLVMNPLW